MNNLCKTELRKCFKNIRNSISDLDRIRKSKIICDRLVEYLQNLSYDSCMVYLSFSSEVQTGEIIEYLYNCGKKISVPECDTISGTLKAVQFDFSQKKQLNKYGICELQNAKEYTDKIDIIIAPGIAFDTYMNRIGFGKGYYDKFINSLNYKPLIIGLAYDEQISDTILPTDEYDQKLDIIITDKRVIKD